MILAPKTIILAFDAFQFDGGVTQLRLSVASGLDRAFKVLDIVRR